MSRGLPEILMFVAGICGAAEREPPSPFQEPVVEHPADASVDTSAPGRHVQVNFPASASAGRPRLQYWLTGREALELTLEVGLGPDAETAPLQVFAAIFIDGRQVPITVDARKVPQDVLALDVVARQRLTHRLKVADSRIPRGVHAASIVLWDEHGAELPGHSFLVFKDSLRSAPPPPVTLSPAPVVGREPVVLRELASGTSTTEARTTFRIQPAGRFALEATLSAAAEPLHVRLVALAGGRQLPLGKLGPSPRFALAPGERGRTALEMSQLRRPRPGAPGHPLVLFMIPDVPPAPHAASKPPGFPRLVGRATW